MEEEDVGETDDKNITNQCTIYNTILYYYNYYNVNIPRVLLYNTVYYIVSNKILLQKPLLGVKQLYKLSFLLAIFFL